MQKKSWYIRLVSLGISLCVFPRESKAQTITVQLPETHIVSGVPFEQTVSTGSYLSLLSVAPTINAKANTPVFNSAIGSSSSIPLNLVYMRLYSVNGITLLNGNYEIPLSQAYQTIFGAVANLTSGPIVSNFRVLTNSHTWEAGIYHTPLAFEARAVLLPGRVEPNPQNLELHIPAFLTPQSTIADPVLWVNDFSFFRSTSGITGQTSLNISSSVPLLPKIHTGQAQFNFSTDLAYNQVPMVPVGQVKVGLQNSSGPEISPLSTQDVLLSAPGGIPVPERNTQWLNYTFSLDASTINTYFKQAGTYTVPLHFTWEKPMEVYPSGPIQVQQTAGLTVEVSDLGELIANQAQVSLSFDEASDYQTGVAQGMPKHLRISKTTPYTVYVRALNGSFQSGSQHIPLNVLEIGPMDGEMGINTLRLSTTAQPFIEASDPVIDRYIDVLYRIPPGETQALLGKPSGQYAADIVFSFVAP